MPANMCVILMLALLYRLPCGAQLAPPGPCFESNYPFLRLISLVDVLPDSLCAVSSLDACMLLLRLSADNAAVRTACVRLTELTFAL